MSLPRISYEMLETFGGSFGGLGLHLHRDFQALTGRGDGKAKQLGTI